MKKIDVGQVITIAANVGVIAGIAFLAIELRQNTAAIRSQSSIAVNDSLAHLNEALYDNPELTDIWIKGRESLDSLSPSEAERFAAFVLERLNLAVYVRELERSGSADTHIDWIGIMRTEILQYPGLCDFLALRQTQPVDLWQPMIDECVAQRQ